MLEKASKLRELIARYGAMHGLDGFTPHSRGTELNRLIADVLDCYGIRASTPAVDRDLAGRRAPLSRLRSCSTTLHRRSAGLLLPGGYARPIHDCRGELAIFGLVV